MDGRDTESTDRLTSFLTILYTIPTSVNLLYYYSRDTLPCHSFAFVVKSGVYGTRLR